MWDEHDCVARWIQGLCVVGLAVFALFAGYFLWSSPVFMVIIGGIAVFCGSAHLSWRCLRYALTGRSNVNRDDF